MSAMQTIVFLVIVFFAGFVFGERWGIHLGELAKARVQRAVRCGFMAIPLVTSLRAIVWIVWPEWTRLQLDTWVFVPAVALSIIGVYRPIKWLRESRKLRDVERESSDGENDPPIPR